MSELTTTLYCSLTISTKEYTYQKKVGGIVPRLEGITPSFKVVGRLFHRTLVHDAPLVQENNAIKGFENVGSRLVNGKEDAGL
jgi:hypothetical protein